MMLGIANMISQIVVVTFVIVGVVAILLAIHFGSEYLFGERRPKDDTESLREELSEGDAGISRHNIFYRFFFRGD